MESHVNCVVLASSKAAEEWQLRVLPVQPTQIHIRVAFHRLHVRVTLGPSPLQMAKRVVCVVLVNINLREDRQLRALIAR